MNISGTKLLKWSFYVPESRDKKKAITQDSSMFNLKMSKKMIWKDPDIPFWVFNCGDPLDAALSCNEWAESVGSWLNVIFSVAVRRLCCSLECNCLVPSASGSEWFNAGFQLWLPVLDFNLIQAWMPTHARTHTQSQPILLRYLSWQRHASLTKPIWR